MAVLHFIGSNSKILYIPESWYIELHNYPANNPSFCSARARPAKVRSLSFGSAIQPGR
jgi:hypothetical protein